MAADGKQNSNRDDGPQHSPQLHFDPSEYPQKRSPPRSARQSRKMSRKMSARKMSAMHDICKGEKNDGVPAHHAEIKQVSDPHESPHSKKDENSDHLDEQDAARRTKDVCKAPYKRVHFEGAVMKCDQGRSQIKYLKHDKAGSCT